MRKSFVLLLIIISCSSNVEEVYYPDGSLKEIRSYKGNSRHGKWILFHENGDTSRVYLYKEDSLKSMRVLVNNNTVLYRDYLDTTIQHGKEIFFHPNGQAETISEFRNGLPHGPTLGYYQDGKPQIIMMYENGKGVGEFKQFYPNGHLFMSSEDYSSGIFTYYDSAGIKKLDFLMRNGKSVDTLKVY